MHMCTSTFAVTIVKIKLNRTQIGMAATDMIYIFFNFIPRLFPDFGRLWFVSKLIILLATNN